MRAIVLSCAAFLLFFGLGEHAAMATPINVGICIVLGPSYTDAVSSIGDDHFTSNPISQPAWGMHLKVVEHGTTTSVFNGFLQRKDDTNPGCTNITGIPVDTGKTYDVHVITDAYFATDSNTLVYKQYSSGNEFSSVFSNRSFSTAATYTTFTTGDTPQMRVMAVSIRAISTHSGGVTGATFEEFGCTNAEATTECGAATSCNHHGKIYFDTESDQTVYKTVIAKELGNLVLNKGAPNAIPSPNTCATPVNGCPSGNDSGCPSDGSFVVNSLEYHSAAIKEGFGRFYRDAIFNNVSGSGCGAYDKSTNGPDWDLDTFGDGHFYACDGPPISGMADTDYEAEKCGGASSLAGLATVYDYERFFWDMDHTEGADISDLIEILSDANAGTGWNRTYLNNSDDVVYRLNTAVSGGPWVSAWAFQEGDNGVFR